MESISAQADLLSNMLLQSTLQYENITDNLVEALTTIMVTPTLFHLSHLKQKKESLRKIVSWHPVSPTHNSVPTVIMTWLEYQFSNASEFFCTFVSYFRNMQPNFQSSFTLCFMLMLQCTNTHNFTFSCNKPLASFY